jgi:hypothetical protein
MVMDAGEVVLRGSIGLSLVVWAAAECGRLAFRRTANARGTARRLWTLGFVLALLHVALAFHLRHGWSHAAALAETARQTEELLGFRFGGGVYVNYAFLAVWGADVLWWWGRPASFSARPVVLDGAIRAFLLFIFVNGAIVFAHGAMRVFGSLALGALGLAWYVGRGGREGPGGGRCSFWGRAYGRAHSGSHPGRRPGPDRPRAPPERPGRRCRS